MRTPLSPWRPLGCAVLLVGLVLPAQASESVRVRLFEQHRPKAVEVAADGGALAVYASAFDTNPIARLEPGDRMTLSLRGEQVYLQTDEANLYANALLIVAEDAFALHLREPESVLETRRFQGRLRVGPDPNHASELRLVNDTNLDTYVAGVLVREYGMDDLEGSKAMAVVIRTYALRAHALSSTDYDVVDHVGSQVYHGIDGITPRAEQAVAETKGQVLTHRGQLIEAVHSASSGGHTADNESIWRGRPLSYLRGRPDPYDRVSPYQTWTSRVDRARLLAALSRTYGFTVTGFLIGEAGADGRVREVELLREGGSKTIRASAFRALLNRRFGVSSLRSTAFDARRDGDAYVFEGRGYGHGVGLSQWGAHGQALEGRSYREILSFYYEGVQLSKAEGRSGLLVAGEPATDPLPKPAAEASEVLASTDAEAAPPVETLEPSLRLPPTPRETARLPERSASTPAWTTPRPAKAPAEATAAESAARPAARPPSPPAKGWTVRPEESSETGAGAKPATPKKRKRGGW